MFLFSSRDCLRYINVVHNRSHFFAIHKLIMLLVPFALISSLKLKCGMFGRILRKCKQKKSSLIGKWAIKKWCVNADLDKA